MSKLGSLSKYLLAILLMAGTLNAQDKQPEQQERGEAGLRAMPHKEYVTVQEDRAEREEEAKSVESESEKEIDETEATEPKKLEAIRLSGQGHDAKVYHTTHDGAFHYPVAVSLFGETVELEDGSIWSVKKSDRYKTLDWMTSDPILITQNTSWFSSYYFKLVNTVTGETVRTNLTVRPFSNGVYTHWIVGIDYYNNEIALEDGSVWHVSHWDGGIIDRWVLNDEVIIGVNNDWLTQGGHPNILINAWTGDYAISKCVY